MHLQVTKGADNKWTITKLRESLRQYIVSREKADIPKPVSANFVPDRRVNPQFQRSTNTFKSYRGNSTTSTTTGALTAYDKKGHTPLTHHQKQQQHKRVCRFCSKNHWSDECPKFKTIDERKAQIKGCCYKCLREGHMSPDCKSIRVCVYCNKSNVHHRSLCPEKFRKASLQESVNLLEEVACVSEDRAKPKEILRNSTDDKACIESALLSSNEIVMMQTSRTEICDPDGQNKKKVRILLDSGSQRTYITERLAKSLNLKKKSRQEIRLVTFGSDKPKVIRTMSTQLNIQLKDGQNFAITANIVPTITGSIQRKPVSISNNGEFRSLIKNLTLADDIPTEEYTDSIDLLLGNDYYLDIVLGHKIEIQPGLYLLSSKLGWILSGRTSEIDDSVTDANMLILSYGNNITKTQVFTTVDKCVPKLPDIEDFWNIETIGLKDSTNGRTEDDQAIDEFKESLVFKDNRYYVKWPWRGDNYEVPENRPLAFGRLKSLVKRFKDNPDVLQKYDSVIQDQLEKGIIEKVETSEKNRHIHYLPHHAVIKPDKSTTKLRIVYDASAKSKVENNSLNDCLYR
ncbi:uncharacterized protein LOC132728956 [Ruditapes philippinarum]|uniref:uncharacterized protein LOC132728956 n=1 Tax=Ruditapes philippinarum TaxID=129788 RepID=UPI00295ABF70|nr:uncharacterized protein LOC132728956 [Ruditapes philippinarum]